MDLSNMHPSRTDTSPSTPAAGVFRIMALPAEIRMMIYDAVLPSEVHRIAVHNSGISSRVRALMATKTIRDDFLPRLFSNCHFIWHATAHELSCLSRSQDSFRQYAIPFIKTLTIHAENTFWDTAFPLEPFEELLRWMRWRSVRSHLHPWHLKHLKFVAPDDKMSPATNQHWQYPRVSPQWHEAMVPACLLTRAPNVSGLDSLKIIFYFSLSAGAAMKFFDRCSGNGILGMVGVHAYSGGEVFWLCLENGQLVVRDY